MVKIDKYIVFCATREASSWHSTAFRHTSRTAYLCRQEHTIAFATRLPLWKGDWHCITTIISRRFSPFRTIFHTPCKADSTRWKPETCCSLPPLLCINPAPNLECANGSPCALPPPCLNCCWARTESWFLFCPVTSQPGCCSHPPTFRKNCCGCCEDCCRNRLPRSWGQHSLPRPC